MNALPYIKLCSSNCSSNIFQTESASVSFLGSTHTSKINHKSKVSQQYTRIFSWAISQNPIPYNLISFSSKSLLGFVGNHKTHSISQPDVLKEVENSKMLILVYTVAASANLRHLQINRHRHASLKA